MKNLLLLFGLVFVCLGCQQEQKKIEEIGIYLTADIDGFKDATKTTLSEPDINGIQYPLWKEKDEIAVFSGESGIASKFYLTSGAGTSCATFWGSLSGASSIVGIYPYSIVSYPYTGEEVYVTLPDEQLYCSESFADGSYPMFAKFENGKLIFKNLCSVLKVPIIGNEIIDAIKVEPIHGNPISGLGVIQLNYQTPELIALGNPYVTLVCEGVQVHDISPTNFYIVIPVGFYKNGFRLIIYTSSKSIINLIPYDITLERSHIYSIPEIIINSDDDGEDNYIYGGNESIGYEIE